MSIMEEQKELIINTALSKFKQYGIKSVSIDDICREMGMSKKTFYVYFPGKEELIMAVLEQMNADVERSADKFMEGKTALECITGLMDLHSRVSDVHKIPPFSYDLRKYYPKLYKEHVSNVHLGTKKILMQHLEKGKQEGVYREDLDVEMCAIMFSLIQQSLMQSESEVKNINMRRLARFTMDSFIRSIVSEEGSKKLAELLKKSSKPTKSGVDKTGINKVNNNK